MLNRQNRDFIRECVTQIVNVIRSTRPTLTPGEIYDGIAAELERRCQEIIDRDVIDREVKPQ